ncbi:MAG: hypothetical protein JRE38_09695 [Deltaproteobacteria bacterium]|nr:hypothetical protein [Deltaproteobacteria bacterium]MBW2691624.1 hypothetical protein [Deltaproteobacteria bacterium]
MSRAKQNSVDQLAIGVRRAAWMIVLLLLIAAPAQANRIVQVRVGNHPSFTRLVFEMDAFAGYQVERRTDADGVEQLTVTLEASTPTREITSKSVGIESVNIPASADQAIAQIRLRKSGLQMKEMILSNPPRIVLDFVHSAAEIAELTGDPYAKPAPTKPKPVIAKPKPAPKPAPEPVIAKVIEPKPAPEPVIAKVIEPKPKPEPVIAQVVEPKPLPKIDPISAPVEPTPDPISVPVEPGSVAVIEPESVAVIEPEVVAVIEPEPVVEPEPEPIPVAVVEPEPVADSLAAEVDRRESLRNSIPGAHKPDGWEPPTDPTEEPAPEQIADAADTIQEAPLGDSTRVVEPVADVTIPRVPSPSDINRRIDKPKPKSSGLPFDMLTMAGIAAAALIVLVVAVRLFRRRSLPQDLDVTTLAGAFDGDAAASESETADSETSDAEASDSEASDRIPAQGFEFATDDSATDDGPTPLVEEQNTAAYSLSEVAANTNEPETGLYDEDSEGEKPMDMETTDLPTERDEFSVPPAAAVMGGADSDVSQLVQELASRIANLETRLDEANDSRERLERQVAAQSEELRVQRAAIARTQRALRSLSRTEEDQATEPALREPSQPAK